MTRLTGPPKVAPAAASGRFRASAWAMVGREKGMGALASVARRFALLSAKMRNSSMGLIVRSFLSLDRVTRFRG
jgi:hypothetical protein